MVFRRISLALLVGVATAVLSAIVIAIIDMYLSGHGHDSLTREWLTWSAAGVHLSIGDVIVLGTVLMGAALTWRLCRRNA